MSNGKRSLDSGWLNAPSNRLVAPPKRRVGLLEEPPDSANALAQPTGLLGTTNRLVDSMLSYNVIPQVQDVPKSMQNRLALGDMARTGLEFIPGLGDVMDATAAYDAAGKGMYTEAGLSGLGLLPLVPGSVTRKLDDAAANIKRLFRAQGDANAPTGRYFSEEPETAFAYTNNPGFGGGTVISVDAPVDRVLDLSRSGGADELLEELPDDVASNVRKRFETGEYVYDFEALHDDAVKDALRNNFDWVRFEDNYPAHATTYAYMGDPNDLAGYVREAQDMTDPGNVVKMAEETSPNLFKDDLFSAADQKYEIMYDGERYLPSEYTDYADDAFMLLKDPEEFQRIEGVELRKKGGWLKDDRITNSRPRAGFYAPTGSLRRAFFVSRGAEDEVQG